MDAQAYRVSQRRPQACKECTKRKRKCDKELPCGRCRRLKLDCTRETVRLRNLSTKHAEEVAFLESLRGDLSLSPTNSAIIQKLDTRISALQFGTDAMVASPKPYEVSGPGTQIAPGAQSDEAMGNLTASAGFRSGDADPSTVTAPLPTESKDTGASILTALEYMAWGRSFANCYPHISCTCHHQRRGFNVRLGDRPGSISLPRVTSTLPSIDDARRLVLFHIRHLAWHHNCLHGPTFLDECEGFWRTGACRHPLWLASYLSVLSSTVYCVQNSRKFTEQLGIDLSRLSSNSLFQDMLDVLYSEDFLGDVSLYSVQAIVISTEVAHNLGFSQLNAILIGAAIRIAQCLGLHKIASRDLTDLQRQEHWDELVDVEVGKRIWCQMVIQDLFAIPFNDSYGILPPHCSTELPLNCDDDLVPMDQNIPTVSSYCRTLAKLALLMPEMAEGLGPVTARKPLQQQFEHVLRMDQKMRDLVRQIPSFLLREDASLSAKVPWLSIARRSLAITAADKIIMIHRPFLFRAFQSPTYTYTRRTCVAAAMTILREHSEIALADDLSIWTHSAFCITAAVILCFEVSYRLSTKDGDVESFREAIQSARDRLVARRNDVLASRGVTLIDVISLEETALGTVRGKGEGEVDEPKIIDLPRVVENFFAVNKIEALSYGSGSSSASPFEIGAVGQGIGGEELMEGLGAMADMHDFDEWYNNTFNEGAQYGGGFV